MLTRTVAILIVAAGVTLAAGPSFAGSRFAVIDRYIDKLKSEGKIGNFDLDKFRAEHKLGRFNLDKFQSETKIGGYELNSLGSKSFLKKSDAASKLSSSGLSPKSKKLASLSKARMASLSKARLASRAGQ